MSSGLRAPVRMSVEKTFSEIETSEDALSMVKRSTVLSLTTTGTANSSPSALSRRTTSASATCPIDSINVMIARNATGNTALPSLQSEYGDALNYVLEASSRTRRYSSPARQVAALVLSVVPGYVRWRVKFRAEPRSKSAKVEARQAAHRVQYSRSSAGDLREKQHVSTGILGAQIKPTRWKADPLHGMTGRRQIACLFVMQVTPTSGELRSP